MRLSEAILLGDIIRERDHSIFLVDFGHKVCGCALGGAWLAVGKSMSQWRDVKAIHEATGSRFGTIWPWLIDREYVMEISRLFADVAEGRITLDALCDQVRAWGDELAAKGINVEQVTMAAELNQPASPIQSVPESASFHVLEQDVAK